jgi:hypothetical protein
MKEQPSKLVNNKTEWNQGRRLVGGGGGGGGGGGEGCDTPMKTSGKTKDFFGKLFS